MELIREDSGSLGNPDKTRTWEVTIVMDARWMFCIDIPVGQNLCIDYRQIDYRL